jgi:hypothetical protein
MTPERALWLQVVTRERYLLAVRIRAVCDETPPGDV